MSVTFFRVSGSFSPNFISQFQILLQFKIHACFGPYIKTLTVSVNVALVGLVNFGSQFQPQFYYQPTEDLEEVSSPFLFHFMIYKTPTICLFCLLTVFVEPDKVQACAVLSREVRLWVALSEVFSGFPWVFSLPFNCVSFSQV